MSIITAAALLLSIPAAIGAEESVGIAAVSGLNLLNSDNLAIETLVGETLKPTVKGTEVKWYIGGEEVTDETKLDGNNLIVTFEERGKSIKCSVDGAVSAEINVGKANLSDLRSLGSAQQDLIGDGKITKTAAADTFKADGKLITLLDTYNNSKSTFIGLFNPGANRLFDTDETRYYNYYNPERETNIAYFLNTDTTKVTLSANVRKHINMSWPWLTEPAYAGEAHDAENGADYTKRAGIVLPALWEIVKYKTTAGYQDYRTDSVEMFRTAACNDVKNVATMNISTGNIYAASTQGARWYRAEFTLDRDFFLDTNVTLSDIGANVWAKLAKIYSYPELLERFDEETLAANGITPSEGAFSVKAVSGLDLTNPENLAIDKIVGETLSAERSGETVWYVGGKAVTDSAKLDGDNFIVTYEENGKYVTAAVDGVLGKWVKIGASELEHAAPSAETLWPQNETADDNSFFVQGKRFALLDTYNNSKSTFLVISANSAKAYSYTRTSDLSGNAKYATSIYTPDDIYGGERYSLGYVVDKVMKNDSSAIPSAISGHINNGWKWITEPGSNKTADLKEKYGLLPYTVSAGMVVPAKWEYEKYKNIIGRQDLHADSYEWTRSSHMDNYMLTFRTASDSNNFHYAYTGGGSVCWARPMFTLDRSFFLSENVTGIGANVYAKLARIYSLSEMVNAGYDRAEMIEKGFSDYSMTVSGSGTLTPGESYTAAITVKNNTQSDISGVVAAVVYGENGAMLAMSKLDNVTVAKRAQTNAGSITFDSVPSGAAKIKIFYWESINSAKPICINYEQ